MALCFCRASSSLAAVCFLKEGEKGKELSAAEALSRDTKADLLSSAPPPVVAEALQPNEEVASSGRQLIVRPACTVIVLALEGNSAVRIR